MTNLINSFGPLLFGPAFPEPFHLTGRPVTDQAASAVVAFSVGQSITGMIPFGAASAAGSVSLVSDVSNTIVAANAGSVSISKPSLTQGYILSYQVDAPLSLPTGHYRARIVIAGTTLYSNRILYKADTFPLFQWRSDYNLNGVLFEQLPDLKLSCPLNITSVGSPMSEDEMTTYGEITTGVQVTVSSRQAAFVKMSVRTDAVGIQIVRSMLQHKRIWVNSQPHAPKSGLQVEDTVTRGLITGTFELWNNDNPSFNRTIL